MPSFLSLSNFEYKYLLALYPCATPRYPLNIKKYIRGLTRTIEFME